MSKRKTREYGVGNRRKESVSTRVVYFLGYNEKDIETYKKKATISNLEYRETLSFDVTHIILNINSIEDIPCSTLYFGIVSGAWFLRPEWLWLNTTENTQWQQNSLDVMHFRKPRVNKSNRDIDLHHILELSKIYNDRQIKLFEDDAFKRVLLISNNDQVETDVRSILEVSGATIASPTVIKTIELKGKNENLISLALVFSTDMTKLNKQLMKILLEDQVPVIYYEHLYDFIDRKEEVKRDVLMTISQNEWGQYYMSLNKGINKITKLKISSQTSEKDVDESWLIQKAIGVLLKQEPIIYKTWFDYIISKPEIKRATSSLKENNKKVLLQPQDSINTFRSLVSEYEQHNSAEVIDMVCNSALSFLLSLNERNFLPHPSAVSFIFYKIILQGGGKSFGCEEIAYLFIKELIRKYPPYDIVSRLYWLKALNPTKLPKTDAKGNLIEEEPDARADIMYLAKIINYSISKNAPFPVKNCHDYLNLRKKSQIRESKLRKAEAKEDRDFQFNALEIILDILEKDLYFIQLGATEGPQNIEVNLSMKNAHIAIKSLAFLILDNSGKEFVSSLGHEGRFYLFELSKIMCELEYFKKHFSYLSRLFIILFEAIHSNKTRSKNGEFSYNDDLSYPLKKLGTEKFQLKTILEAMPIAWMQEKIKMFVTETGKEENKKDDEMECD